MPTIRVAIPAMDELDYLPVTLDALCQQKTNATFEVYICVNQPDNYWSDATKSTICEHNRLLLEYLQHYPFLTLHVLDYSSPGKGWIGKKTGVGFARKVLFEKILSVSEPDDLIVSLDADTYVEPDYLESIASPFRKNKSLNAIAVPYYHRLDPQDEICNRTMLRYELYMRNYAINLLKIKSPYGFTALGSAIVMRTSALRKVGNITPLQSGEDFYLVQKFCKMGGLSLFNTKCVYPASRFSDRVPFGTGPAMIQGSRGIWDSYPIYPHTCFAPIQEAYTHLHDIFDNNFIITDNDFLSFLQKDTEKQDIWQDIRKNVSDYPHFVKAFHQKADGLRLLQYVRTKQRQQPVKEEVALYQNLQKWIPSQCPSWFSPTITLNQYSIQQLNSIRDALFHLEQILRRDYG